MKTGKQRAAGLIALILGAVILFVGICAGLADREGTPFAGLYSACTLEQEARSALETAIASATEALPRAERRAADAQTAVTACLTAAQTAMDNEAAGSYDGETDLGLLGQSIIDARTEENDLQGVLDSYSAVANADLVTSLDAAKTEVDRAERAVTDTADSVQAAITAALLVDPDAVFDELPVWEAASVPKLGDLAGTQRLLTRANNYQTRTAAAQTGADAITAAGTAAIARAGEVLAAHPLSLTTNLLAFARSRSVDLLAYGVIFAAIGLALLLIPTWVSARWKSKMFRKGFWFVLTVGLLGAALHYATGTMWDLMRQGTFDTLYMTIPSTIFAYIVGLPLGVLLVITSPGHISENATVNTVVGTVVNFLRSIPFVILLVLLFDVTRVVMGSAIGTRAIIFPLFVSAFPYVARIVEGSLAEVDRGVVEAAQSMGSSTWQIIRKVLVPEALPSLINGAAICMTTILAYTAMAGSAGGDGLGKIAITYGLNYREYDVMYVSSLLMVALVQIIQIAGGILTRACDHRKR